MGILDDTELFSAIIQCGGFSRAAKHLKLSNGLVSRRIASLEAKLGVSLIKRTTRELSLTPEGEIFWKHAQKIQEELHSALSFIQASSGKPKGTIRISAPIYFGRHYLTPILVAFLSEFENIKIDLILSNNIIDPIKERIDLSVRGAGYLSHPDLKDSSLQMKLLFLENIRLYASPVYLQKHTEPETPADLKNHTMICYAKDDYLENQVSWTYFDKNKEKIIVVQPKFNSNDIESSLAACELGYGIARFTELNAKNLLVRNLIKPILKDYDWGQYKLYLVYPQQRTLPKRSRLLLDFIHEHMQLLKRAIDHQ